MYYPRRSSFGFFIALVALGSALAAFILGNFLRADQLIEGILPGELCNRPPGRYQTYLAYVIGFGPPRTPGPKPTIWQVLTSPIRPPDGPLSVWVTSDVATFLSRRLSTGGIIEVTLFTYPSLKDRFEPVLTIYSCVEEGDSSRATPTPLPSPTKTPAPTLSPRPPGAPPPFPPSPSPGQSGSLPSGTALPTITPTPSLSGQRFSPPPGGGSEADRPFSFGRRKSSISQPGGQSGPASENNLPQTSSRQAKESENRGRLAGEATHPAESLSVRPSPTEEETLKKGTLALAALSLIVLGAIIWSVFYL